MKAIVKLDDYTGIMFNDPMEAASFIDGCAHVKSSGYGNEQVWTREIKDRLEIVVYPDNSPYLPGNDDTMKKKMDEMEKDWRNDRSEKYRAQQRVTELEAQIAELVDNNNHKEE